MQEYRRWGKIKGTYLDGYLRHVNNATVHKEPVLRNIPVKPAIEQVIQPQGIVAVGAGIADGFRILRGKLVIRAEWRKYGLFMCNDIEKD